MTPLKKILLKLSLIREKITAFEISFNFKSYTPIIPLQNQIND